MTTTILGVAAVALLALYLVRRNQRMKSEDNEF